MVTVDGLKAIRSVDTHMADLAAVILVGGKSSRMGRDKALLPIAGKRLVDVVADAVRAADITHLYVSGTCEGYASIPDLLPERGPVGGICSCVVQLSGKHTRLLFIPVDMPRITPELLRLLIAQPSDRACHFAEHPLPCIVPVHKVMLRYVDAVAQDLARKKKVSVKEFLSGLAATPFAVSDSLQLSLTNTNTPEEWKEVTYEHTY